MVSSKPQRSAGTVRHQFLPATPPITRALSNMLVATKFGGDQLGRPGHCLKFDPRDGGARGTGHKNLWHYLDPSLAHVKSRQPQVASNRVPDWLCWCSWLRRCSINFHGLAMLTCPFLLDSRGQAKDPCSCIASKNKSGDIGLLYQDFWTRLPHSLVEFQP